MESSESPLLPTDDLSTDQAMMRGEYICGMCNENLKEPRILNCLHEFCTSCLALRMSDIGVECCDCKQMTSTNQVEELKLDVVLINLMEMEAIRTTSVTCTSCKAQENAVARCSDCATFLCPSCVTAHNYMRCFENHKVESFDDLKKEEARGIHKPMLCKQHISEPLKYYCKTCQEPICTECTMSLHKQPEHTCDRASDIEDSIRHDLEKQLSDVRKKLGSCDEASLKSEMMLSELQLSKDNAKDQILETYQSFKAILEKKKDEVLESMYTLHSKKVLAVMELFDNVGKSADRAEETGRFIDRVSRHANAVELLSLTKLIGDRLNQLLLEAPEESRVDINIEVNSNLAQFENELNKSFCKIATHRDKQFNIGTSLFDSSKMFSATSSTFNHVEMLPAAAPEFVPQRMPHQDISSVQGVLASLLGLQQQHQQQPIISGQFASGVERSRSRNSYSPSISDSGVDLSSSASQTLLGLQALIKQGHQLSFNQQGKLMMDGIVVPGLNWNFSNFPLGQGSPPQSNLGSQRPVASIPSDTSLASLLSSVSMASGSLMGHQVLGTQDLASTLFSAPQPPTNMPPLRSGSPINAAVAAANLLSSTAQSSSMGMNGLFPTGGHQNLFNGSLASNNFRGKNSGKIIPMEIRTKFGQLGPVKGQFNSPHGFCLGMDEDIVVADTNNHRIQVFEKNGEFKYQFGIPGREEGQLWYPRKVAVIRSSGKYVVCDRGSERSRMQLFTRNGQFIKKISIRYIDIVAGLVVTAQGHIVAVDSVSPTVFCISETGDLVKWFDCSEYMREPSDIAVNGKDYYVCDFKGHCVVVFNEDGQFLHRIGCESITNYPNGIDISDAGDVLIGDSHGNRFHVAVFQRDGSLIGEFECPYVKVSRCCGLKITSEGYIVTLAKNNQHVLVLNTLYIN